MKTPQEYEEPENNTTPIFRAPPPEPSLEVKKELPKPKEQKVNLPPLTMGGDAQWF